MPALVAYVRMRWVVFQAHKYGMAMLIAYFAIVSREIKFKLAVPAFD
jgi:hypothetical protein